MSNPENKNSDTHGQNTINFESQVSEAVQAMSAGSELPEGTSEEVKYAATTEKRRRDTQASYTKSQQKLAILEAEKTELLSLAKNNVNLGLTEEQTEELEDLKFSDPDAWRSKVNTYETEALNKHNSQVDETLKDVSVKTSKTVELEQRNQILADFQAKNTDFKLNDDILANDVPPRITRKLENGTVNFEGFLQEVYSYLNKGKVIADEDVNDEPNLSKAGGGNSPDEAAMNKHSNDTYKDEIY